jgi:hypothetical protein
LSGVAEFSVPATTPDPLTSGRQDTLVVSFDLRDAFARMGWPATGLHGFQVAQGAPFIAVNSVFGATGLDWSLTNLRVNTVTRFDIGLFPVENIFGGVAVDISTPDVGARTTVVSCHVTLLGRMRRHSVYR